MDRNRKNGRILFSFMAVLIALLSAVSCVSNEDRDDPELMVSLYIPDAVMTRAGAGTAENELKVTTLQVWAFLSDGGAHVSYGSFDANLGSTGLKNGTVTRFGLPLTDEMFATLTTPDRKSVV